MLAGTANLARFRHDFPDTVYPVLEALEEHVVLLKLFGETQSASGLTVRIGHENRRRGYRPASLVQLFSLTRAYYLGLKYVLPDPRRGSLGFSEEALRAIEAHFEESPRSFHSASMRAASPNAA